MASSAGAGLRTSHDVVILRRTVLGDPSLLAHLSGSPQAARFNRSGQLGSLSVNTYKSGFCHELGVWKWRPHAETAFDRPIIEFASYVGMYIGKVCRQIEGRMRLVLKFFK